MKFFAICIALIYFIPCQCQVSEEDILLEQFSKINSQWYQAISIPGAAQFIKNPDRFQGSPLNGTTIFQSLNDSQDSQLALYNETIRGPIFYPKCGDDLVQILYNLNSEWALKMLDSSGKLMNGILLGSVTWPGNYKECLSVYAPLDDKDHGDFHGRYCTTSWKLNASESLSDVPISAGVCVPDSCHGEDISTAIRNVLKLSDHAPVIKKFSSRLTLNTATCKTGTKSPDAAVIIFLFILCTFLVLVICGSSITAYEYLTKKPEISTTSSCDQPSTPLNTGAKSNYGAAEAETQISRKNSETGDASINCDTYSQNLEMPIVGNRKVHQSSKSSSIKSFFLCFCAFTNGSKILKVDSSSRQLLSIHGVRFLSLTWVIIGHTYINAVTDISNKLETLKDIDSFSFQMLMQSPFSVDSFFLLSGALLAYLFLKEADNKNGKINWAYFYLHRIWRLTPVYMLLVGFYMLVFKYMGSGPFWDDDYGDSCRHTWWWYLLYINNFIPINDMCIGWSWYLANDMQFYLMSPLYLYTLWKWPKLGIAIISTLMAGSWIVTAVLTSKYEIIPMLAGVTDVKDIMAYQTRMWNSFDIIYDKPYCRISPYLVGILLGYALHKTRNCYNFFTWWQQALGWILAILCSGSVIFGLYHVEMTNTISVIYNSLSRTSFVLGLAWVIFACETGHGGVIHKLLSWNFWIPLSRLTYCAYLVHPVFVHGYYYGLQTVFYFTHITVVTVFLGILVASYVLAFAVSFTFESPMMNLEKLLLKRSK